MLALEPAALELGRMRVELCRGGRIVRLDVRQFTPEWLIVEVRGGWIPAPERCPATLELVGLGGFMEELHCGLKFAGWMAVSGDLGEVGANPQDKLGVARMRIDADPREHAELIRVYRQLRFPGLVDRAELDVDALPPELGAELEYRADDGAVIGRVSVSRANSRSWLVHQLGVVDDHPQSGAGRAAIHDYFATLPLLIDGHQRQYLYSYYDRSKPWQQLLFDAFVDWYDDHANATIVTFDRFELVEPLARAGARSRAIEVDQARPAELDEAVALLREQLPGLACAAFDLDAAQLDRAYLHPDYASHGIARGRRVFVVREGGQLVGLALCEAGGEHFDLAHLHFRVRASNAARDALAGFVANHYRALGQRAPWVLAPTGAIDESELTRFVRVETLGCMIWTGHCLRAYRTFLRTTFARIGERARRRGSERVTVDNAYLPRVVEARARLRGDHRLAPVCSGGRGPVELLGFLLHFTALAVRMTENVDWVGRAGFASAAAGCEQRAVALAVAAERETIRGRMLLEDLFELGQRWCDELGVRIDVELLLRQPPPRSLLRWIELRQAIASGPVPAGLLAMDLELAWLFSRLGPTLLEACERSFGDLRPSFAIAAGAEELDDRSTALERELNADPSLAGPLAEAGSASLNAVLDVLCDCVELGRELAGVHRTAVPTGPRALMPERGRAPQPAAR